VRLKTMPNHNHGFDEVMIVNPYDPTTPFGQGATLMPYHYGDPSAVGYYGDDAYGFYAQPPEVSGWGESPYYGQAEPTYGDYEPLGYYAEPGTYGYYAAPGYGACQPVGYYADETYGEADPYGEYETVGYYAEPDTYGYYAQPEPYGYYAQPEYAEYEPVGYYGDGGEMVGYGAEPFEYPGADYYGGGPDFEGYVRDAAPTFNAGCPVPSNVAGYGDAEHLEGYVRPTEVSPSCGNFTPQPGPTASVPETFRSLWE
jgi:hypothetical protein